MALFAHPVIFADEGVQVHVNCVPATFEVSVTPVAVTSHCVFDAGELERSGAGNTVTTKSCRVPGQEDASGRMW